MSDWLLQVVKPFQERATNRQQILQLDVSPELPPLSSDIAGLERILSELLNNACKYTPSGQRIILEARVSQTGRSNLGEVVQLKVTNLGVKIPAEELPRIFDKFYRVPSSGPWKQGGTGLGLALVQKLVAHLDGSVRVESTADQTCFTVELPLKGQSMGINR